MNELIENTLNIISKISSSRQGYLLQLGEQGYSILNIWGGKGEDFNSLNDLLSQLLKAGVIDTEKVGSLPSVRKILKERFSSSFFMKDLIYFSERNLFIYILLFSDNPEEFKEDSKNIIMPVLSILSHQVKEWFEQQNENKLLSPGQDFVPTERKKIIDEWENKFNLLVKTSPDLIFILDYSGKIILINEAAKNYLEFSSEEMKGKYFLDFINKDDKIGRAHV